MFALQQAIKVSCGGTNSFLKLARQMSHLAIQESCLLTRESYLSRPKSHLARGWQLIVPFCGTERETN